MKHLQLIVYSCITILIFFSSCRPALRDAPPEHVTAILGAFEREVTLLEDRLTEQQEHEIERIRFVTGRLNGRRVVVAWTGVGKVNAAMTATLLIEHFNPAWIIFTGIAGAVNPELRPGDIVIAEKTAHHDMGTIWLLTPL